MLNSYKWYKVLNVTKQSLLQSTKCYKILNVTNYEILQSNINVKK